MRVNTFLLAATLAFVFAPVTRAATSAVNFNADTGMLSVTGSCSGRYVLVVIKNTSSGAIWGSSNPPCASSTYNYTMAVPDDIRTGGAYSISAFDNGVSSSLGNGPSQPVILVPSPSIGQTAPAVIGSSSITLDTSSLAVAPDDISFVDSVLQSVFGIATSVVDTVESTVVAAVQVFAKMFTVLPGGSIRVPEGQNQISGQGILAAGDSDVFIANTSVTSSSEIIITPTSPTAVPLAVAQIVDGNGFHVDAISPQQISVSFSWLIVGTYATGASSSVQAQMPLPQLSGAQTISPVIGAVSSSDSAPSGTANTSGTDLSGSADNSPSASMGIASTTDASDTVNAATTTVSSDDTTTTTTDETSTDASDTPQ